MKNASIMHALVSALSLSVAAGCNPWDNLPRGDQYQLDEELWSDDVVAAQDGLYVRLPHAGLLLRLTGEEVDDEFEAIDLRGAEPISMALGPDERTVVVFAEWRECTSDEEDIETFEDCPEDEMVTHTELVLVRDGERVRDPVSVPSHFNQLAFSPWDADTGINPVAVAYLDYEEAIEVDGVLNLTEVLFVDLQTGDTQSISVGFAADNVLFSSDGSLAVVLSRNQVVAVDLTSAAYGEDVVYPLALDADVDVDPLGAAITPDDRYLLMSVEGSGDLYAMDLESESINMLDLTAAPSAMAVDDASNRTALVYGNLPQVDILEHDYFLTESLELDEACTAIAESEAGFVMLYNNVATTHDVYLLELETAALTEYRLPNPVYGMQISESGAYAVAMMRQEWDSSSTGIDAYYDENWGMSVLDLSGNDHIDLVLESEPVGMALATGSSGAPYAILLLEGRETVSVVDLWSAGVQEEELVAPPTGIGAMPGGGFYITHDSPLGLVSFFDPDGGEPTTANGFAATGLFTDDSIPASEED